MEFEPYTFGVTPILQTLIFLFIEAIDQVFFPEKFNLELIKLPDGGTLGLDWDGEIPDPEKHPDKPLLIMIPGVAGGSHNLYQLAMIRHVRDRFKLVTLLMRGSDGVPITSGLLCHPGSWEDIQAGINHIVDTYSKDKKTGVKRCRVYAYGCSMGASILGLYLIKDGEEAAKQLDASVLYGTPWHY